MVLFVSKTGRHKLADLSVRVRNGMLDSIETTMGTSPTLRIRSGAKPANAASASTGTVLATITLPSDWASAASAGVKQLLGTWADGDGADADGTAGHFEIEGTGAVIDMRGTVTATGNGGEMQVNNTSFATGQPFSVTVFDITDGNP